MHIRALKTPAANDSLRWCDSASLRRQLSASEAPPSPPTAPWQKLRSVPADHNVALHFNMSENKKTKYRLNNICLPIGKDAIYNFILYANYNSTIGNPGINIQVI